MPPFTIVFSADMQFRKVKNDHTKELLKRMLEKIEKVGPGAGTLLDPRIHRYEMKHHHPPLRMYFQPREKSTEIEILKFELKTSQEKQQKTIEQIKKNLRDQDPFG